MSTLLLQAIERVQALPPGEQDAVAFQILEILDGPVSRDGTRKPNSSELERMALVAAEQHRRGETIPLEDIL